MNSNDYELQFVVDGMEVFHRETDLHVNLMVQEKFDNDLYYQVMTRHIIPRALWTLDLKDYDKQAQFLEYDISYWHKREAKVHYYFMQWLGYARHLFVYMRLDSGRRGVMVASNDKIRLDTALLAFKLSDFAID